MLLPKLGRFPVSGMGRSLPASRACGGGRTRGGGGERCLCQRAAHCRTEVAILLLEVPRTAFAVSTGDDARYSGLVADEAKAVSGGFKADDVASFAFASYFYSSSVAAFSSSGSAQGGIDRLRGGVLGSAEYGGGREGDEEEGEGMVPTTDVLLSSADTEAESSTAEVGKEKDPGDGIWCLRGKGRSGSGRTRTRSGPWARGMGSGTRGSQQSRKSTAPRDWPSAAA